MTAPQPDLQPQRAAVITDSLTLDQRSIERTAAWGRVSVVIGLLLTVAPLTVLTWTLLGSVSARIWIATTGLLAVLPIWWAWVCALSNIDSTVRDRPADFACGRISLEVPVLSQWQLVVRRHGPKAIAVWLSLACLEAAATQRLLSNPVLVSLGLFAALGAGPLLMHRGGVQIRQARIRFLLTIDGRSLELQRSMRTALRQQRRDDAKTIFGNRLPSHGGWCVVTGHQDELLLPPSSHTEPQRLAAQEMSTLPQTEIKTGGATWRIGTTEPGANQSRTTPHFVVVGGTGNGKSVLASSVAAAALAAGRRVIVLTLKGSEQGATTTELLSDIRRFAPDASPRTFAWPWAPAPQRNWQLLKALTEADNRDLGLFTDLVVTLAGQDPNAAGSAAYYVGLTKTYARLIFPYRFLIGSSGLSSVQRVLNPTVFGDLVAAYATAVAKGEVEAHGLWDNSNWSACVEELQAFGTGKQGMDFAAAKESFATSIERLSQAFPNVAWNNGQWWDSQHQLAVIESPPGQPEMAAFLTLDLINHLDRHDGTEPITVIIDEIASLPKTQSEVTTAVRGAIEKAYSQLRSKGVQLWTIGQSIGSFGPETFDAWSAAGATVIAMQSDDPALNDRLIKRSASTVTVNTTVNDAGATTSGHDQIAGIDPDLIKTMDRGEFVAVSHGKWTTGYVPYNPMLSQTSPRPCDSQCRSRIAASDIRYWVSRNVGSALSNNERLAMTKDVAPENRDGIEVHVRRGPGPFWARRWTGFATADWGSVGTNKGYRSQRTVKRKLIERMERHRPSGP